MLELRYGLDGEHPRTLDEVGRTFNVTRERIRQIENQSLKKLADASPRRRSCATSPSRRPRPRRPSSPQAGCADPRSMFDVHEALEELVRRDGSDLHLKVGSAPLSRVHGAPRRRSRSGTC